MNLQLIKDYCEKRSGGLRQLAEDIAMSEPNLHRCIRINKIQAGDLEKIAKELKVPVSVFFEEGEGNTNVHAVDHSNAAGRDLHIGTSPRESELEKENTDLRQQLITAQAKIISLMETQSKELIK